MAEKLIRLPQLQTFKQQADLKYQDKLTAGTNITISGTTISATDTTYSDATTASAGLMSSTDKVKLNGIESGANNYTLPIASTGSLGGIKVGTNLSIDSNGVLSTQNFGQQTLYNTTITSAGWSGTSNTVSVQGIAAGDDVEIVGINPTGLTDQQIQAAKEALSLITYGTTSTNAITFYALGSVPNINIPVTIRRLINNQLNVTMPYYSGDVLSGNRSVSNDTLYEIGNVTLDPGYYNLTFTCQFASNATGYRQCGFSVNNTDITGFGRGWSDSRVAIDGTLTQTLVTGTFYISASDYPNGRKFYFLAKQNSGGVLTAYPRCYYMKF